MHRVFDKLVMGVGAINKDVRVDGVTSLELCLVKEFSYVDTGLNLNSPCQCLICDFHNQGKIKT